MKDLLLLLDLIDAIHSRSGFNNGAKFGSLGVALVRRPANFAIYHEFSRYTKPKKEIHGFGGGGVCSRVVTTQSKEKKG